MARLWTICRLDLRHNARRPLFWIWLILVGLLAWGLSEGNLRISSGDSDVGGDKSWITSEFGVTFMTAVLTLAIYGFFMAVAAGMTIIRDSEQRIDALLHSTPLRPREYVLGKFLGAFLSAVGVFSIGTALSIYFNHIGADAASSEFIGPLSIANYVKPLIFFALPTAFFLCALSFYVGERWRRPILVFFLPLACFLACEFFLWEYSPSTLAPLHDKILMLADPAAFRWLNETLIKVDLGVEFYNTKPIPFDLVFWSNRAIFVGLGLFFLWRTSRHFERNLRSTKRAKGVAAATAAVQESPPRWIVPKPLADLRMSTRKPGFVGATRIVAAMETRELATQPGLYIFVPIIILMTVTQAVFARGAFDTPLLNTPGSMAVRSSGVLTIFTSLLLMFYTVESLRREDGSRLSPLYYSTPIRTGALLTGKAIANSLVGVAIMLASFVTCFVVLTVQGDVAFDAVPFAIVWGALLVPTFFVWSTFVSAAYALTRNRYTTYGIGLAALAFTTYKLIMGELNWVTNWPLWNSLQWSDISTFELDRTALLLNRVIVLSAAVFFIALTVRVFPRRDYDATRMIHRLRPKALLRSAFVLSPFWIVPITTGWILQSMIDAGFRGDAADKAGKDYWRKNMATWRDTFPPDIVAVDVDVELEPAENWLKVDGTFDIVNLEEEAVDSFCATIGTHWEDVSWTINGEDYEPEDRQRLMVFTPEQPLEQHDKLVLGFRFEGHFPNGVSKNGGGASEFIVPSGVVLTAFTPSFVPLLGYSEGIGVDQDNAYDAKEYADDYHTGVTRPAFGFTTPFPVKVRVTSPADFRVNSVGTLVSDEEVDGRRVVQWESDHPVRLYNIVGGRWDVRRGEGTAIFYHPEHHYNIDEMIVALDASRKYYSEWFYPFPWEELKLSEFPALAGYAQGFATNITFSEGIGFLTRSNVETNAAFMVTAHEAAHQWWGNLLTPGRAPGGNILSEGMAHFSTLLLHEEVLGLQERIGFAKLIESSYGESRQIDSERAMVKIDGSRSGDTTVTYDKGGWVFWMLLNEMGRDNALAGIQSFISEYTLSRDHPVLQDFVAHMRPFAPDAESYDAFVDQWFFDVVVPQYELSDPAKSEAADGASWEATTIVRNVGTGTMEVEVCASRGERFAAQESDGSPAGDGDSASPAPTEAEPGAVLAKEPAEPYRESRTTVTLGPGEEQTVTLPCDFEPQRIVVDPDALVLQLKRDRAVHEF